MWVFQLVEGEDPKRANGVAAHEFTGLVQHFRRRARRPSSASHCAHSFTLIHAHQRKADGSAGVLLRALFRWPESLHPMSRAVFSSGAEARDWATPAASG